MTWKAFLAIAALAGTAMSGAQPVQATLGSPCRTIPTPWIQREPAHHAIAGGRRPHRHHHANAGQRLVVVG